MQPEVLSQAEGDLLSAIGSGDIVQQVENRVEGGWDVFLDFMDGPIGYIISVAIGLLILGFVIGIAKKFSKA